MNHQYFQSTKVPSHEISNVSIPDERDAALQSSYEITRRFINGTQRPITVIERNNLQVTFPPQMLGTFQGFIIRVVISLTREVNVNTSRLSNGTSAADKVIAEVFRNGYTRRVGGRTQFQYDYHVSPEDIESNGGSLYLTDLDVVVSNLNPDRPDLFPNHPYSEASIHSTMLEEDSGVNTVGSFGYSLRIIDSNHIFGERYININKQVFRIPVIDDSTLKDGVYLTSSGPATGRRGYVPPTTKRYTFEEADESLGLYQTMEEARTLGDVFSEKEREFQEYKLQNKRDEEELRKQKTQREAEFDRQKHELERQKAQDQAEVDRGKRQLEERERALKEEMSRWEHERQMESIRRKDWAEERSTQRKDSSEMVKYLPAIFTGVLALFVAFNKATSK